MTELSVFEQATIIRALERYQHDIENGRCARRLFEHGDGTLMELDIETLIDRLCTEFDWKADSRARRQQP